MPFFNRLTGKRYDKAERYKCGNICFDQFIMKCDCEVPAGMEE